MKKKILFLPDAGPQNPFQYQLIAFLEKNGFEVAKGKSRRFLATWKATRQHKPDVIYYDWIQSFILGKSLPVTLLKCVLFWLEIQYLVQIRRIPIVHTLHNMRNHARRWVKIEKWMYQFFLRKCSRIRVYSDTTRTKATRFFQLNPDRLFVLPDIPYHYYYPNTVTRAESRAFLHLNETAFVYLFVGMVKPYKGLEECIQTFAQLDIPDAWFIIAGASDNKTYEQSIRKKAESCDRILYHSSFVKLEEIQYYMNAADVVLLPFKNVEHSGSVDLALSFGKPIITRRTPFLQELLSHQAALLFTKKEKPLAMALKQAQAVELDEICKQNFAIADQFMPDQMLDFFQFATATARSTVAQ